MARSTKSIDNLEIKITANAQNANQALENLTKNITNLGNALNGIDTKTFTDGIKGIGQAVKGVNLTNFQKQMTKMSKAMSSYASNMAKVVRNTRSGTSGFNSFARGVDGMYSGLTRINNKVNEFASRMKRANRETKNFAQTVGLLYARFFLLIRGAKGLIGAVKSSMNYIEVLNYFDSSFGQVAERGVEKWSDMGYQSAQAYYDSFSERAKKVTADMSGFFPEENGTLTKTSMASLGMNPQQLMQYQAQFAQMSSSMGTTSEQALILSEVLTKLGADLASVKNMEFEDTWKDMASGLVGMSRTLDKYGANIRNANMDMKLHELGIDANVKSLSQADKALLRTIILLDASKYAWTDLATTLDTPANQFRMLSNNVKLLGQMIGNLLLPVVAKILPYINAFVIALQRLFMWLGKVLGIDLSNLTAKKKSGGDNSPISDILDDAEDLSGALDDDADSAKKLKKQLQGFDALNNLTTNEDKTKGLDSKLASGLLNDAFLDAVEDYLKAWQDAFDQLENKAEKIADKIQKFFMDLIYPIRKAWQAVGKSVVDAWKKAFKSVGGMLKDIGRDFMKMWHEKETILLFRNIFEIIKNIGAFIGTLADKFREAWNYNETGLHIFEALRDILLIITDHIRNISDAFVEWAEKLDLRPLLSQMLNFLESIKPVADAVWGAIEDFYTKVLLPLGKWVLEDGLPRLLQVFIDFNNNVDWEGLRQRLAEFWEHLEPFAETVGEGLIVFVKDIADAVKDFLNGDKLNDFLSTLEEKMDGITARDVANTLEKLAKGLIAVKIAVAGFGILSGAVGVFKTLIEVCKGIKGIVSLPVKLAKSLHTFFTVAPAGVGATAMMTTNISSIGATFTEIAATAGTKVAVASAGATIGATLVGGIASAIAGFKLGKFIGKAFTDDDEWYDSFKWTGEGGFFDSLDYFVTEMIPSKMDELKGNIKIGIGNAVVGIMEKKSEWDGAIEGFKTDTALKTAEIASEFMQFKENVATSLGDMAINAGVKLAEASNKFAEFKTNVSNHIEEAKANVSAKLDEWKAKFTEWKENLELKVFDAEIWRGILDKIRQGASKAWTDLTNWWNNTVVKKLNEWVTSIKKKVEEIKQYFRDIKNELKNGESLSWQMPWNRNTRNNTVRSSGNLVYANGGFPEDGMFFANHNELVGKFSNGKTAVANNDQIVSGIENGVYGAMSESNSLLEEQNSLLRALLDKEMGIKASDIFDSVMSSADSYERQTGRKAFA